MQYSPAQGIYSSGGSGNVSVVVEKLPIVLQLHVNTTELYYGESISVVVDGYSQVNGLLLAGLEMPLYIVYSNGTVYNIVYTVLNSSGRAVITYRFLETGEYILYTGLSGHSLYSDAWSNNVSIRVDKYPTELVVRVNTTRLYHDQYLLVNVSGLVSLRNNMSKPLINQNVTLYILRGDKVVDTIELKLTRGYATRTLNLRVPGTYTLYAVYSGNYMYKQCRSDNVIVVVELNPLGGEAIAGEHYSISLLLAITMVLTILYISYRKK